MLKCCQVWCLNLSTQGLRQGDHEFDISLGYIVRLCQRGWGKEGREIPVA